jgi:hypothetical protein
MPFAVKSVGYARVRRVYGIAAREFIAGIPEEKKTEKSRLNRDNYAEEFLE